MAKTAYGRAALQQLESAKRLVERAARHDEQDDLQEASSEYLDAYALVSAAHVLLDMTEGDEYADAFDEADALRDQLHEELLERLGVHVVSAEEIAKAQERRRRRMMLGVIPGGKRQNRKRRLLRA